jgi:hypothetical protein
MADAKRVHIGFGIGQSLQVKLSDDQLADLRKAVESGGGWYDLETDDGAVALNLATVVFLRVDEPSHAIGFSGS